MFVSRLNSDKDLRVRVEADLKAKLAILKAVLEVFIEITLDSRNACDAESAAQADQLSSRKIEETIAQYERWPWWQAYFLEDRANYQKALERQTSLALEVLFPSQDNQTNQDLTGRQNADPSVANTAQLSDLEKIRVLEGLLNEEEAQNSWQRWWDGDLRAAVRNQIQIQYIISVFSFLINPASEALPFHELEQFDLKLQRAFTDCLKVNSLWSPYNKAMMNDSMPMPTLTHSVALNENGITKNKALQQFVGNLKYLRKLRAIQPVQSEQKSMNHMSTPTPKLKKKTNTPQMIPTRLKKRSNVRHMASPQQRPVSPALDDIPDIQPINFGFAPIVCTYLSSFTASFSAFMELARVALAVIFFRSQMENNANTQDVLTPEAQKGNSTTFNSTPFSDQHNTPSIFSTFEASWDSSS